MRGAEYEWPVDFDDFDELDETDPRIVSAYEEYDRYGDQFETPGRAPDEMAIILKNLGVDFFDHRGAPLLCTEHWAHAAEAAARGIRGRLPSMEEADQQKWEKSLEDEARRYLMTRRGR